MIASGLDPSVKPVRLRSLLTKARGAPVLGSLDVSVSPGEALLVWTAAILAARQPISETDQDSLLTLLADRIVAAGNAIAVAPTPVHLVISDGTMVVMTGMLEFLDLRTGDMIKSQPRRAIETTAFDLTELFRFHKDRIDHARADANSSIQQVVLGPT